MCTVRCIQGLLRRRRIELPLEGLRITSDDATILLRTEDEEVYLNCPEGLAREKLLQNLRQSIARAEQDPFTQPEVPQNLAEMLGQEVYFARDAFAQTFGGQVVYTVELLA